jgi:hypothetical protein
LVHPINEILYLATALDDGVSKSTSGGTVSTCSTFLIAYLLASEMEDSEHSQSSSTWSGFLVEWRRECVESENMHETGITVFATNLLNDRSAASRSMDPHWDGQGT